MASSVTVTDCIAHRGASGVAPENTIAAFKQAVRQGASAVEMDVHRSADEALIVMHDSALDRTTNVTTVYPGREPWNISDFTLDEILQLDAGSWFSGDFAGEKVPTLTEAVRALGANVGLMLEVKRPYLYPGIETDIYKELASESLETYVVESFDVDFMRSYREVDQNATVGVLFTGRPSDEDITSVGQWSDQISLDYSDIDDALVGRIHDLGRMTNVYTVNDSRSVREQIGFGVDGIITNYPNMVIEVLKLVLQRRQVRYNDHQG